MLYSIQVPTTRLLLVLTFRPEFAPPWPARAHLVNIALSRLPRTEAEAVVCNVSGGKPLPPQVLDQIISKTDGVPLFVEELTKTVLESDLLRESDGRYELTGPLPPLAIPSTLQDSLTARLDRLGSVRDVAHSLPRLDGISPTSCCGLFLRSMTWVCVARWRP